MRSVGVFPVNSVPIEKKTTLLIFLSSGVIDIWTLAASVVPQ